MSDKAKKRRKLAPPFINHNPLLSPCLRHNCSVFFILAGYLCRIAVGIDFIAQLPQGFSIVSGNNQILRKITINYEYDIEII